MYWYEEIPNGNGVVLSTRVRFARNLEEFPFPHRMKKEDRIRVFSLVKEAFAEKNPMAVSFSDMSDTVKETYVQTHLASRELASKGDGCGLILSRDGDVSVMVGEEDHIRLQVICAGKNVEGAMEKAKEWASLAEKKLRLAYRDGLGYLTACPTNLGAAMRLSVMIHLPALTAAGAISSLTKRLGDAGFTVRGTFGEGSRESGDIYQISNQRSREKTPDEIACDFVRMLEQVEELEARSREEWIRRDRIFLEDRASRALGTLKYAKKISYGEFISLYSLVRFGREAGFEEMEGTRVLDRLWIELMPAPMTLREGALADPRERDIRRSQILRETLSK